MVIRRAKDEFGHTIFYVSAWVMNSLLAMGLAWISGITVAVWQNSVMLGQGPRFTSADGAELRSEIFHLNNDIRDVILLYESCDAKIDFDRERRAEVFAEFQLIRSGLVDHAKDDERRFRMWLNDNGVTNVGPYISPGFRLKDSIVPDLPDL